MKTTLDELKAFVAVVDGGSITAAAEALELTISATSRTLARLEDKLQTTLLRRTTRRLELTEEGAAFLEYARTILATVDEAEEQMAARRLQPVGRLRVDAATPFMLHVIVPLLEGFRERYPQVELELNSNEGITDLIEKRTDVAFRIGVLRDSTLHARPIGHSRIRVVASPEYLPAWHADTRGAAAQARSAGFYPAQFIERVAAARCRWRAFRDRAGDRFIQWRDAAADGGGWARHCCLSDFLTRQDRREGRLVQLLGKQTQDVRQPINAVYYRNTALAARITCFVDHVTQTLGQRPFDE